MISGKVVIVILNWNQWEATLECLRSLAELDYPDYQVILLDNNSSTPLPFDPAAICPGTVFIQNGANYGFGKGNNPGITKALSSGAEFVWLLNNDTLVYSGTLKALVRKIKESKDIGAVGSVLYDVVDENQLLAWGGGFVDTSRYYTLTNYAESPRRRLDYLTAASMLLRTSALEQCGMFDENFFMYWEDVDLCWRLRKNGWRLEVAEDAEVLHHEGKSCNDSALKDYFSFCSTMRFAGKHSPNRCVSWALIIYDRIIKNLILCRFSWFFRFLSAAATCKKCQARQVES